MALFSRNTPKLPDYRGTPLHSLLADAAWSGPLARAGIVPSSCDLVHLVPNALVAARGRTFSRNLPFLTAGPAVVFVQGQTLALAVPDEREVLVLTRPLREARLMLTRFRAVQLVFGADGAVDGWTFDAMRVDDPQGREFGDLLHQYVTSG